MQFTFEEIVNQAEQFESASGVIEYIRAKNIDCSNHVALFLDVFSDNGFDHDYRSEGREWVLLPIEVANETNHIKMTFDGTIIAETKNEQGVLRTAGSGYDDVLTPQVFYLGKRTNPIHDVNEIATLLNIQTDKIFSMVQDQIIQKSNNTFLLSDEGLDTVFNETRDARYKAFE